MPDTNEIHAQAPDGTTHVFPANTPDTVVDSTMKAYIGGGSAPVATKDDLHGQWPPLKQSLKQGAQGAMLGGMEGLGITASDHPIKDTIANMGTPPAQGVPWSHLLDPTGGALTGAIGMGKSLVSAGQQAYRGYQDKDPMEMGEGVGSSAAQALLARQLIDGAGKNIDRGQTLDKARVSLVNTNVKTPLSLLDHAVNTEIGKHANAVIDADDIDNKLKGVPQGQVNMQKAAQDARDYMGKTFKPVDNSAENLITKAETQPMHMREAKAFTTDVGKMANSLARNGRPAEAAALNKLYDGAHDATADRASTLGMSQSWQHYIDETSSYKQMQSGLLGDLQDAKPGTHAQVLSKLADPAHSTEVNEIAQKMKQYNVPPEPLIQAKDMGARLSELSQTNKNLFVGKLKAISKHPLLAGGAAAGAAVVGGMSGIPGASFILPLLVAGKVAGVLDAADVAKIVKGIAAKTPPGFDRVHPEGEGPMPVQRPPSAPNVPPPQAGGAAASPAPVTGPARPNATTGGPSMNDAALLSSPDLWNQLSTLLGEQTANRHMAGRADKFMADKVSQAQKAKGEKK